MMFEYKLIASTKIQELENLLNLDAKEGGWRVQHLIAMGKSYVATLERELLILTWNASPETDLAGYKIYSSRTPANGVERTWVLLEMIRAKPNDPPSYPIPLALYNQPGTEYAFAVSAFDIAGNESKRTIIATIQR